MATSSPQDYQSFKEFLEKNAGILLGDNKQYLVATRLKKILEDNQLDSLGELVNKMQQFSHRSLKESVVDAMTTNETLWFRDTHPFDIFKNKLLPEFQESARGGVRIWSAACSSGQEPYSLSMMVEEYRDANGGLLKYPVDIVGTDLSPSMLDICRSAEYDALSLGRGLSPQRRKQFFDQLSGDRCRVKATVAKRVKFQALNLMDRYLSMGRFDAVFCRNVLIYFSAELKSDILRRIHATLKPGGYLIIGASEGLGDVTDCFEMVHCRPGLIYRAK